MINKKYLTNIVFPWILLSQDGSIFSEGSGILFKAPDAANSLESLMHYKSCKAGWSVCPNGYAVYTVYLSNYKLVIYGLKVEGVSTAKGKVNQLTIKLTKAEFEDYLTASIESFSKIEGQFQEIVRSSLHEVRKLSSLINSNAWMVSKDLENTDVPTIIQTRVAKIKAAQELLHCRLEYFDFIFNPSVLDLRAEDRITVYSRFHKSVHLFKEKGIRVDIGGASFSEIKGSTIFDIVPYVLIDNAVKYSPTNGKVEVAVNDRGNLIDVKVASYGPFINEDEEQKIFEQGYRGSGAKSHNIEGNGIGLSVVKSIAADVHKGLVNVSQDRNDKKTNNGKEYYKTVFSLTFNAAPKH